MSRSSQCEIAESVEQLKQLLSQQKNAVAYRKVQALYLLKSQLHLQVQVVAEMVGVHRVTLHKWLRQYQQQGLSTAIAPKQGGGRQQVIGEVAMEGLKQRLSDPEEGFSSYGQIQQWLEQEYGLRVAYKTVHGTVRYRLKAKLKVPRRQSVKHDPQQAEAFKKNCLSN